MGLIQFVKGLTSKRRFSKGTISSSSDDWHAFFNRTKEASTFEALSKEEQLRAIQNQALVFACVTTLASAFQEAPLIVEQKADDVWSKKEEHQLLDPFQKNPFLSESDIMSYIVMHLELTGQSFIWKWKNKGEMVQEMWPIPPSWVEIVPSEDARLNRVVAGYTIKVPGGSEYQVPESDMVYMRFPDPRNLWGAISPIRACSPYLQLETKALEFKGKTLDSLKVPGLVIKTPAPLTTDQKRDLRTTLASKLGSQFSANDAITLSGKEASLDLLNPAAKINFKEFSDLNESRICMVFRVPPVVIGALVGIENSPWSNVGEAKRWLYKNTIFGLWKMVQTGLTRSIIPTDQRPFLRYKYDLEDVKELQENIEEVERRANELYSGGVITRGEARVMIKRIPQEGDNVYKTRINDAFIESGAAPENLMGEVMEDEAHMVGNEEI